MRKNINMPMTDKQIERFRSRYIEGPEEQCWMWQGKFNPHAKDPRATFAYNYTNVSAPRIAFFLKNGHWPKNLACHTCDNGMCVNPSHIWDGTHKENMEDMVRKGRSTMRDVCYKGHALVPENLYIKKSGERECRACRNACKRRSYHKLKVLKKPKQATPS